MADWEIKSGDENPIFTDTLTLSSGVPAPLQQATAIAFQMRALTSAKLVSLTGEASFVDKNNGTVQYQPSAGDTATPGNYLVNWLVTFENETTMSFPTDGYLWAKVEQSIATAPQMIISPADVKQFLNINPVDRTRDSELMDLIGVVTPLIEDYIGPVLPRNFDEWHDGGSNMIELLRRPSSGFGTNPVMELVAVSEYRGPIEYPLAIVASPVFGSIYSVFLNADMGTITRRSAGGATIAFMPGRESVHVIYQAGQAFTPPNVAYAAKEAVRTAYMWTKQTGSGSRSIADGQEVGPDLQYMLTRMIRTLLAPSRRAPSFA